MSTHFQGIGTNVSLITGRHAIAEVRATKFIGDFGCCLCASEVVVKISVFGGFLAADLLNGRAEAFLNVRPSVGMADTMDRNIWDIIGEVKPSVNSGLCTSGVAPTTDEKPLSTKNPA